MSKDTLPLSMIAKAYGFESLETLEFAGGLSSKNYFALANNKHHVVIKLHRSKEEREIIKIAAVAETLSAASLLVPVPIKTSSKKQYLFINNNFLSVYPKLKGVILNEPELNTTALTSTAGYLAKLHNISSNLRLNNTVELMAPIDIVAHEAQQVEALIQKKSKGNVIDSTTKRLLYIKLQLLNDLTSYTDEFKRHLLSKPQLVHGDFHNQNILFNKKNKLVGILDFEEAHYGHPTEDIMHFIQLACCNTGYARYNLDKASFFLKQYLDCTALPLKEIELGWYLYLYKTTSSFFLEKKLFSSTSNKLFPLIERDVRKLEYLCKCKHTFIKSLLESLNN